LEEYYPEIKNNLLYVDLRKQLLSWAALFAAMCMTA
jgi:hypothetical protein